jgi:hypothetical protein
MAWKDAANCYSDKEKFRNDLNRPESYEMSERHLKTLRKSGDFQGFESLHPLQSSFNGLDRNSELSFRRYSDNFDTSRLKAGANSRVFSYST